MGDEWQKLVSIFGNALAATPEILAVLLATWLLFSNGKQATWRTIRVTLYLFALGLGGIIRIGWWAPGLFLAPEGQAYHPFFIGERWFSYIVGSPLMVLGMTGMLVELFHEKRKLIWAGLGLGFLFSSGLTFSYHMAEKGYWNRQALVDRFNNCFPYDPAFERVIIRGYDK